MGECRNCSSTEVKDLGFVGAVEPFFLKRVYNMEIGVPVSRNRIKRLLGGVLGPVKRWVEKLQPSAALVELQICLTCSFVQMKEILPEEWINRMYSDYRSDSYNNERTRYEPSYAAIAEKIGLPQEAPIRVAGLTKWLAGKMDIAGDFTMLDFGGADGRFLPDMPARKYVFEISDYPPATGITRIESAQELGKYSYVQLAHVLEHVMHPLQMVQSVSERVEPGGFLYVEVPQDDTDATLADLRRGEISKNLPIHEHVNRYSAPAVTRMLEQAGLDVAAIETERCDFGYATWTIVRGLGRKKK